MLIPLFVMPVKTVILRWEEERVDVLLFNQGYIFGVSVFTAIV
jgi:hypothetical protein